ncbi:MAG: hypothetical protein QOI66_3711 [Myxococcales bacterium]|jgi:hypothetical protein|nr:hypothetical protein [Myxococcales bacterium]
MMNVAIAVVLAIWAASAGIPWMVRRFSKARRLFGATQAIKIADAQEGLIRVRGVVRSENCLEAPLSRRACIGYRIEIDEYRGRMWLPVLREADLRSFVIDDGSGSLFVDVGINEVRRVDGPSNVRMELKSDLTLRSGILVGHSEGLTRFMMSRQADRSRWTSLRCSESSIRSGESVSILGFAERNDDVSQGQGVRTKIVGSPTVPIYIKSD